MQGKKITAHRCWCWCIAWRWCAFGCSSSPTFATKISNWRNDITKNWDLSISNPTFFPSTFILNNSSKATFYWRESFESSKSCVYSSSGVHVLALQILWLLRLSLLSLEYSYLNLITLVRFLNCCKCNSRNMHLTALVMGLVTHSSNRPCAYFARGLSVLVEVLAST